MNIYIDLNSSYICSNALNDKNETLMYHRVKYR